MVKKSTYQATRPDLTQREDEELENLRPDHHNLPQVLRHLADRIQDKELDVAELAIVARPVDGDVMIFGAGGEYVNSATTYFLLHQGAKALMNLVEENNNAGHD